MTKIICDMTGCKYNNSCCLSSAQDGYCTRDNIELRVDEDMMQTECKMFAENNDKEVECKLCQIAKYGGIKVPKKVVFEEVENTNKFNF